MVLARELRAHFYEIVAPANGKFSYTSISHAIPAIYGSFFHLFHSLFCLILSSYLGIYFSVSHIPRETYPCYLTTAKLP